MNTAVSAIVLAAVPSGDGDRFCTLLTDRMGVIRANARGAQRMKNKNFTATAQFAFGRYQLFEHKDRYTIDESDCEELFLPLRDDLDRLALAQYLCELAGELAPDDEGSGQYLRLLRGALWLLSGDMRPQKLVKAVTEIRMVSMAGYQPDLVMCGECGEYDIEHPVLTLRSGRLCCAECWNSIPHDEPSVRLEKGSLAALRHAVYSELQKVYSFELSSAALETFSMVCEQYLLSRVEHSFTTLEFLHSLSGT